MDQKIFMAPRDWDALTKLMSNLMNYAGLGESEAREKAVKIIYDGKVLENKLSHTEFR
jgi:hypothetical protein